MLSVGNKRGEFRSCEQNEQYRKKNQELFQEEISSTTRTTTKQKSTSAIPPHAKHQWMANSHHEMDSEDDTEEVDDTLLTKANIPTIVDAILSNFSMESTSTNDDREDISCPVSRLISFFMYIVVVISC